MHRRLVVVLTFRNNLVTKYRFMLRNFPEERKPQIIFSFGILNSACLFLVEPVSFSQCIHIASKLNFLAVANVPGLNVLMSVRKD
jgi:hypothetical protein